MPFINFYEYDESRNLLRHGFYALLMAAMRKADTPNTVKLQAAWPEVWADLQERYDAPGGVLDSDPAGVKMQVWGTLTNPRGAA